VEGTYRLSGLQCLGHARNRYFGSDWARTQRQRNLISQMVIQSRGLSLSQLDGLLDQTLPLITTNIPKSRLKEFVGNAFSYLKYEIESTRVPLNGMYTEVNYNIIPDAEANCNDLYEKIYGEPAPTAE
jgi:anionic cell wall polymer biosynthesis LytR-Cps2A-Psr (LCP) family protein